MAACGLELGDLVEKPCGARLTVSCRDTLSAEDHKINVRKKNRVLGRHRQDVRIGGLLGRLFVLGVGLELWVDGVRPALTFNRANQNRVQVERTQIPDVRRSDKGGVLQIDGAALRYQPIELSQSD